jgi:hypothetical protein
MGNLGSSADYGMGGLGRRASLQGPASEYYADVNANIPLKPSQISGDNLQIYQQRLNNQSNAGVSSGLSAHDGPLVMPQTKHHVSEESGNFHARLGVNQQQ